LSAFAAFAAFTTYLNKIIGDTVSGYQVERKKKGGRGVVEKMLAHVLPVDPGKILL
jgi:hypothetical protein